MERHWKCTERVSIEPSVLTGVVRQGCAGKEGHRMWWRGQTVGSWTASERPCFTCGGSPKSAPLDKRPSDLCLHPWITWSSQHQSAANTIFEELNWKFVPLYLSKTLLSVTSPTSVFTRLCGSHSDALLVSRAFFTSWLLSELLVHILLGYSSPVDWFWARYTFTLSYSKIY